MLMDMLAVLLRFRCYKIGVIADIEKAFLSIGIKVEDRDALRFLWVDDPSSEMLAIRRMRFAVVFWSYIKYGDIR